jgi:ABC-type Fe3+ transport system permease subunit
MAYEEHEAEILASERKIRDKIRHVKEVEREFYSKFRKYLVYGASVIALGLGLAYGGQRLKNDVMKYCGLIGVVGGAVPVSVIGVGNLLFKKMSREITKGLEQQIGVATSSR